MKVCTKLSALAESTCAGSWLQLKIWLAYSKRKFWNYNCHRAKCASKKQKRDARLKTNF